MSLLNALLRDPALAGTLVIINEFGEIGLDHLLVERLDGDMLLMTSGCLCCSIRGDLIATLEDILRRRDNDRIAPFQRVMIETTGLADPAPPTRRRWRRLLSICSLRCCARRTGPGSCASRVSWRSATIPRGRSSFIQGVQHVFHPPLRLPAWPDADHSTRMVFILRDMEPSFVETLWRTLTGLVEPGGASLASNPLAPPKGGFFA